MVDAAVVTVAVEWTDGFRATLARWEAGTSEVAIIPDEMRDLIDAWLWGEGSAAVSSWGRRHDRSAQAKRVRSLIGTTRT